MTALAKYLTVQGVKVCLITNDLGSNLVDTAYVAESGIPVLKIANGCLCHDVPQLLEKINRHIFESGAEVVIFEPVGSCVDMVDHVYRDIAENHRDGYTLAPVSAIVDPQRFRRVYMEGKLRETIGERAVAYPPRLLPPNNPLAFVSLLKWFGKNIDQWCHHRNQTTEQDIYHIRMALSTSQGTGQGHSIPVE